MESLRLWSTPIVASTHMLQPTLLRLYRQYLMLVIGERTLPPPANGEVSRGSSE